MRGRRQPDALRQVAQGKHGRAAGSDPAHREERAAAHRDPGVGQLHVRRGLQAWHHRKVDPGSSPRSVTRALASLSLSLSLGLFLVLYPY